MQPVFKDYIWGGTNLKEKFHKNTPYARTAESWEVAVHKDGNSTVQNGCFSGQTLAKVIETLGEKLTGTKQKDEKFPLMLKFIDAHDLLSVQVHPDDGFAAVNENGELGKTEMWYVLSADEGAELIYGFKNEISKDEFENAIKNKNLKSVLNSVPVKKGDVFFIPAGTVHAIGKGMIIAEIQQNSNTTYRVYDWDRVDKNGVSRELHVEKAIAVSSFAKADEPTQNSNEKAVDNAKIKQLCSCEKFTAEELKISGEYTEKMNGETFVILSVIEGEAEISCEQEDVFANTFDSFVIPAAAQSFSVKGNCTVLKFFL